MNIHDIVNLKKQNDRQFERERIIVKGELIAVDGSVEVPGRPFYHWVREFGSGGGVFPALNLKTRPVASLPVLIGRATKEPYDREILGADTQALVQMPDYDGSQYDREHGSEHEWPDGHDKVSVKVRAVYPLRCMATGTGLIVNVAPMMYGYNGELVYFPGAPALDLAGYVPASGKRYILIYLNPASNGLEISVGSTVPNVATTAAPYPALASGVYASGLVLLRTGVSTLTEADVATDPRQLLHLTAGLATDTLAILAHIEAEFDLALSKHIVEG